jgi:hypothetical protein
MKPKLIIAGFLLLFLIICLLTKDYYVTAETKIEKEKYFKVITSEEINTNGWERQLITVIEDQNGNKFLIVNMSGKTIAITQIKEKE